MAGLALGWRAGPILDRGLRGFFWLFNYGFKKATGVYGLIVGGMLRVSLLVLVFYGGLLYMTYWGFNHTPHGFIPSQDMGYLLVNVQLPDSTSLERTQEVMNKVERIAKTIPGVRHSQTMAGQSMLLSANGSNFGSMFLILDPFNVRRESQERFHKEYEAKLAPVEAELANAGISAESDEGKARLAKVPKRGVEQSGDAIQLELRKLYTMQVPEAMITVLGPPPVRGVGRAGGFKLMVEDRGDVGPRTLQAQTEKLVEATKKVRNPDTGQDAFVGLTSVFRANVPQLYIDVDRIAAMTKQVSVGSLFDTMRVYLGSLYVNDINLFGRTWQVTVQAEAKYRDDVEDVPRLKVRNAQGSMVPLGAVANVKMINGPQVLTRYNMYPAAPINGASGPGTSSGEGIAIMQDMADRELLRTHGVRVDRAGLPRDPGRQARP